MSKVALEELKKKFKDQKEKQASSTGERTESDYYPFWQISEEDTAVIRTLPIAKQKGALPFIEKDHHKISIDGKDETIPCLAMYDMDCPICELSRKYYKIARSEKDPEAKEEAEKKGKYYYRNRSYLASAYIKKDPLPINPETKENYEGKVKVVQLGNQLYKRYNTQLEGLVSRDEIDDVPWSLENGLDFYIAKVVDGKYAKWDLKSEFARRSSSLPESFIETFEPADLTKYLPANPGLDKVQRMLDAHMNNESYEEDSDEDEVEDKTKTEAAIKTDVIETVLEAITEESKVESKPEKKEKLEVKKDEDSDGDNIEELLKKLKARVGSGD